MESLQWLRTDYFSPHRQNLEANSNLFLNTDSVDSERLHVFAICVTLPRAEVGTQLARKPLSESVEPRHVVSIVEDQQSLIIVQEDTHLLQFALNVQPSPRLGAGAILVAIMHDNAIEPTARLDLNAALAGDGFMGQADHPLGFLRDNHLPVMDAAAKSH